MESSGELLGRRRALGAGAAAAGMAAGAVIASAVSAPKAEAAVGDPIEVGGEYTSEFRATSLRITNSTAVPALGLLNDTGPSLYLSPLQGPLTEGLSTGSIANTYDGPLIGVTDDNEFPQTTYLATGLDLAVLPVPVTVDPTRLLDTRTTAGRSRILQTSSDAFDSSRRLKGGAWLDLAVDSAAQDFTVQAAFVNVTVTGGLAGGYITAYRGGTRPTASTVNFSQGQTIANGGFVPVAVVKNFFAIRLYSSATTHLIVDLSGLTVTAEMGPAAPETQVAARSKRVARRTTAVTRNAKTMRRTLQRF